MGNVADIVTSVRKRIGESEEKDSRIPFNNDKVSKLMDYYQLTGIEIYEIFQIFRKMDRQGTGYINLDNIYSMIGEEVGVISPYLERLFSLIKKQHIDKVNFLEFLPVLATFCLYTRQQLISFVFCMLDTDHNGFISKKDMLNFVADERFGLPIFPQNFLLSIDSMELERPDRISFEQFLSVEQDILFLIYPITRLQKGLQKAFGGERIWEVVSTRLLKLEKDEEKKNAHFQSDNIKKRKAATSEQKSKLFDELIARKVVAKDFKPETKYLPAREPGRRGSDSRIKDKLIPLLEFSPRRHKSLLYIKKEFVAVEEVEDNNLRKNVGKMFKGNNRKSKSKLTMIPGFQNNNRRETKLGKSVTSITSGRKKVQEISRKNSIESIHSLTNGAPLSHEPITRKTFADKSNLNSIVTQSKLNLKQGNEPPLKSSLSLAHKMEI